MLAVIETDLQAVSCELDRLAQDLQDALRDKLGSRIQ